MKPANFNNISRSVTNLKFGGVVAVFIALLLSVFSAQAATDVYTASSTWTAPAGVTSVDVGVWGGGGAGGGNPTNSDGGGGGGGGGYSSSTITVVPSTPYTVVVGAGGTGIVGGNGNPGGQSYFINAATLQANGGAGGAVATAVGGAGGAGGALGVGTTRFSGGNGGEGLNNNTGQGGPGGSSAGTGANGTDGPTPWSTATAGAPPAGGNIGGDGATNADGFAPASGNGGGGGGSGDTSGPGGSRSGGNGAGGLVSISYVSGSASTTFNPTLCVNDASIGVPTGFWTGLTNVGAQDLAYAQASVANSDITNYLKCTGYGFSIPAGATITGITVGPWLNATWTMRDNAMQLVKSGVIQPTNLATGVAIPNGGGALAPAPTQFIYGSGTNLWGNTWTAADINSANFGAAFAAQRGGFATIQQAAVDAMPITVDYTLPNNAVWAINRADPDPTTAGSVSWTVTFGISETGVSSSNFTLFNSGLGGAPAITSVTGSGTTWTVTASTGTGSGTLGLDMTNDTGLGTTPLINLPFTGQAYSVRPVTPVIYYHDTTNGVAIGFDGATNVNGGNQVIPPIITASLNPVLTCPNSRARSNNHPAGLYTHSRWYLNADYAVATNIGANPSGSASLRGQAATDTVIVSLYDYDPVTGAKALIGSSPTITLTGAGTTTTYPYTITSALYTVPAGHRLMLEYQFNQPATGNNARVYCDLNSYIAVAESVATVAPDHLVIQSNSSGLTCAANTLTIVACEDAACATPFTGGVSGTLSASGPPPTVNWDGTTGGVAGAGFVIPAGSSSVTKDVQVATAGTVTFGITSPAPVPTNPTTCNFGNNAPANNNCVFTASIAGFIFSNTATGSSYTIPSQVSGIATPTLYLRAVQASATNPAVCTPAIIGQTTPVSMGYVCNDPVTCQAGNLATINATAIAPGGTGVSLTFDANGSAPITARYDDVGQITLNANKTVTPFGGATAITLNGSSNAYIVKPHHFDLSGIQQTALPNLVNPAAANATDPIFVKAGEQFSVTVTARNFLNAATPNYGMETIPESVKLTSTLVAPVAGTNPVLGNPAAVGAFTNGVATGTTFNWSEAGIITLTPSVADGDYLGAGDTTGTTSANVGRFYPDHLDTAVVATASTPMPCPAGLTCPALYNGIIYSGQPFSVQVTARNLAGGTTANYDGTLGFSKSVALTAWDALGSTVMQNPGPGTLANSPVTAAVFNAGVATTATPTYTFAAVPTAPTDIYIRAGDTDNVSSLRAIPATSVEGGVKVVNGRLKIGNRHGSELLGLPMTVRVQYYNGSRWLSSDTDSVTQFDSNISPAGNIVPVIVKGPLAAVSVVSPGPVTFASGVTTIKLAKPGVAGGANITINAPAYLPSTTGLATFGVYKGAKEFIYRRENY